MAKKNKQTKEEKKDAATQTEATNAQAAQVTETTTKESVPEEPYYGEVIWYNAKGKGFGFIVMDGKKEKEDDIFFHRSQVVDDEKLSKGDRVSFNIIDPPEKNDKQKPMASEVILIEKGESKEDEKEVEEGTVAEK